MRSAAVVLVHSFADSSWALGVAVSFGLLGLVLLGLMLLPHRGPSWVRALAGLGLVCCGALTALALRDRTTKVSGLRLQESPPRLVLERSWPGRTLEVGAGELRAIGLVSLGEDPTEREAGDRQLLFGVAGHAEIRSYVEEDGTRAEELAEGIARAFGLELERFAGPPPKRSTAGRR